MSQKDEPTEPPQLCATLDPRVWEFLQRVHSGDITHDELTDAFVGELPAERIGTREQVLAKLHAKFPTQPELTAWLRSAAGRYLVIAMMAAAFRARPVQANDP